jgi:hypothetical protein
VIKPGLHQARQEAGEKTEGEMMQALKPRFNAIFPPDSGENLDTLDCYQREPQRKDNPFAH